MHHGTSMWPCCWGALCTLPLCRLEHWWQVAFRPDKHPPLSQYSPELTLDHFAHTLFVWVCVVWLLWQLPPLTALRLYRRWTQVLASQMKSFSYVCCLIDKQRQFSLGCRRRMHAHLMSPALAITSGAANDILRSHERSCRFLRMYNKTRVQRVFVVDLSVKHNGLYKKLQSIWTQNYSSQPVCVGWGGWVVDDVSACQ